MSSSDGVHWTTTDIAAGVVGGKVLPSLRAQLSMDADGHGVLSLADPTTCAGSTCGTLSVIETTNGGQSWSAPDLGAAGFACHASGMAASISPSGQVVVVARPNAAGCRSSGAAVLTGPSGAASLSLVGRPQFGPGVLGYGGTTRLAYTAPDAVMVSDDGGAQWRSALPRLEPAGGVRFLDATHGFGWGLPEQPGAVLETTDGGSTWTEPSQVGGVVSDLAFSDPTHGWLTTAPATGSTESVEVHATTDGGATWHLVGTIAPSVVGIRTGGAHVGPPVLGVTTAEHLAVLVSPVDTPSQSGFAVWASSSDGGATFRTAEVGGSGYGALPASLTSSLAGWALLGQGGHNPSSLERTVAAAGGLHPVGTVAGPLLVASGGSEDCAVVTATGGKVVLERTTNGGTTWQAWRLPASIVDAKGAHVPVALDELAGGQLFLLTGGTSGRGSVLWHSGDGGGHWQVA